MPAPFRKLKDEYCSHLHRQNIVQPFERELNWSGKGQHVTFAPTDPIPLTVLSALGVSLTAKVDKALCRRVALARKTMRCSRKWTIVEALGEVYHLQNLRHHHIVQLVGSYLQGREFSILMYPVPDCHLGTFLEDIADMDLVDTGIVEFPSLFSRRLSSLARAFACLTSALAYVHDHTTKHMNVKPQNILVRETEIGVYRMYLADFGLSRSFAAQNHSQTDGPTSRTPRYCAPEVFQHERRGRAADIFSLGCVFAEIFTVLGGRHPHDFADYRKAETEYESFHANIQHVKCWVLEMSLSSYEDLPQRDRRYRHSLVTDPNLIYLLIEMISHEPEKRPTATVIQKRLVSVYAKRKLSSPWGYLYSLDSCCSLPPEQYVVHEASAAIQK